MNINGLKSFNASMSQTLTQVTSQIFSDVRSGADRVDSKKQQIADASLQRLQDQAARAEQRARIDIYV
ncbi:hypothetical protein HNQ59_003310 [Chitinivorax tropicus]|uniref:Uncharacterized protein n=1 Tax=Chitinivorax tropicus TaxID=714531 RepID=A0A840MT94_9PROT|nr:hypothetical protein [Chitinivorax tropicus]MBB5020002.1 hypothetical protein [Chitinivorax tropicus]